jgi:hypothetical protein
LSPARRRKEVADGADSDSFSLSDGDNARQGGSGAVSVGSDDGPWAFGVKPLDEYEPESPRPNSDDGCGVGEPGGDGEVEKVDEAIIIITGGPDI